MFSVTEHEHKENDADNVKYGEVDCHMHMAWASMQILKLLFRADS